MDPFLELSRLLSDSKAALIAKPKQTSSILTNLMALLGNQTYIRSQEQTAEWSASLRELKRTSADSSSITSFIDTAIAKVNTLRLISLIRGFRSDVISIGREAMAEVLLNLDGIFKDPVFAAPRFASYKTALHLPPEAEDSPTSSKEALVGFLEELEDALRFPNDPVDYPED
jgi:hypothetical protein